MPCSKYLLSADAVILRVDTGRWSKVKFPATEDFYLYLIQILIVVVFPNPCCWRRSLCSNLGGIDPEKPSRATLNKLAAGYSLKQCMGTIQQLGIGLQLIHNKIKLNVQTAWFFSILCVLSILRMKVLNFLLHSTRTP